MEFYEREFFIARISCGYLLHKVNDEVTVRINPLTIHQKYEAELAFKAAYEEALVEGVLCPIESAEMLEEHSIWGEEQEESLKKIEKEVEDVKIQVYQEYLRVSGKAVARVLLRAKEKERNKLLEAKHSYDFANSVGIATFARWNWIIENSTTFKDGTPYDWKDISVQDLLMVYRKSILDETQMRELARTEPWRSIWAASKHSGSLFDGKATELTSEQKVLVGWSTMFDSIGESTEAPPDDVLNDDDALDGWLALQTRKRKRDKQQKLTEELMGKHPDAKDVFIKPETKEDIAKIESLNDLDARRIRSNRAKKIKEKGTVPYYKFDDVQRDLQDEIASSQ